jgi:hypothetical protein
MENNLASISLLESTDQGVRSICLLRSRRLQTGRSPNKSKLSKRCQLEASGFLLVLLGEGSP